MADAIIIPKTEDGTRLLRWFLRNFPSMPQRDFYRLCRGGQIRVNSKRVDGREVLHAGDAIRIPPTVAGYRVEKKKTESGDNFSLADLENLRKCIIHNDDDIVVFNKPAGMAVQGGTGIRKSIDKMAAALFPYDKISLVHRLDRETSGVLVVAKNMKAAQILSDEFQSRRAHKEYLALLAGRIANASGVIDNYMARGAVFDTPTRIDGNGQRPQRAITEYRVLTQTGNGMSWMLFLPHTGRTHQLRVHSAMVLKAPIVGDMLYGGVRENSNDELLRQTNLFLFAYRITFRHPTTGKIINIRAQLPDFMADVVKMLELPLP
ncbi:MAG: RluA family pseudouridine synthase [Alphaproteobacteria bacterium]|nr:RluA family pseudouridine synthase [Alphaproteobacteria bacterium]